MKFTMPSDYSNASATREELYDWMTNSWFTNMRFIDIVRSFHKSAIHDNMVGWLYNNGINICLDKDKAKCAGIVYHTCHKDIFNYVQPDIVEFFNIKCDENQARDKIKFICSNGNEYNIDFNIDVFKISCEIKKDTIDLIEHSISCVSKKRYIVYLDKFIEEYNDVNKKMPQKIIVASLDYKYMLYVGDDMFNRNRDEKSISLGYMGEYRGVKLYHSPVRSGHNIGDVVLE